MKSHLPKRRSVVVFCMDRDLPSFGEYVFLVLYLSSALSLSGFAETLLTGSVPQA